jgi:hypothetical protein
MKNLFFILLFAANYCFCATNFVFIHHSVGGNWLDDGDLKAQLTAKGINVHDITYGDDVPGTPVPGMQPNGDYTDVKDWYFWFHNFLGGVLEWECAAGESNQIVMFKSCYPNSEIGEEGAAPGDPTNDNHTVWNHKAAYCSLTNVFAEHPDVLFIAVTAPPVRPGDGYRSDEAARARAFNNWLKNDYVKAYVEATGLRNVAVFDLFDILATAATKPRGANALYPAYRTHDSHPNAKGSRSATGAFLPWFDNIMNYWATGALETNAALNKAKAKALVKVSKSMLKLKAKVSNIGGSPISAEVFIGANLIQRFDNFTTKGKSYISKSVTAAGGKALLKFINKREPVVILKLIGADISTGNVPLKLVLENGKIFVIELIPDAKGKYP